MDDDDNDEQQFSHEISNEEFSIDQPNIRTQFNPSTEHFHNSDEMSDSYAIKSDYDLIAKSPTIESGFSGKDFEDVDDECNLNTNNTMNDGCVVKFENVEVINPVSDNVHERVAEIQSHSFKILDEEEQVQIEAQHLVDSVLLKTVSHIEESIKGSSSSDDRLSSSNLADSLSKIQGDTYRHEHNK